MLKFTPPGEFPEKKKICITEAWEEGGGSGSGDGCGAFGGREGDGEGDHPAGQVWKLVAGQNPAGT